jgi:phosphate:Na+ symporter
MWDNFNPVQLFGGLGMFLFGIYLMEESIKKLSGGSLRKFIRKYTNGTFKSIFVGFLSTVALQSSSALSLIVLAFVGAGVIKMQQAVGLILGANIGSTTTGWIVAGLGFNFNIEIFALPLIAVGGLFSVLLTEKERLSKYFNIICALGLLFYGLGLMKSSVDVISKGINLAEMPNYGILFYFVIGVFATAIMQASSATVALTLTALNAGLVDFKDAAAMVVGADLGTTVTIIIGSLGGGVLKKRVAWAQVGFNLITAFAALLFLPWLIAFVSMFFKIDKNPVEALVLFHSSFNVLGVILFIPFVNSFSVFLEKLVKDRKTNNAKFINEESAKMTYSALIAMKKEIAHLFNDILFHNLKVMEIDPKSIFTNNVFVKEDKHLSLPKEYENIKQLQSEILTFGAGIQMKELSKTELVQIERLLHGLRLMVHSAKSIKDIRHNLLDFESEDNPFVHEQYHRFKERISDLYIEIANILDSFESEKIDSSKISRLLEKVKNDDKLFLDQTLSAINKKEIKDLSVSNIIVANRAFVQSNRQAILALKELVLNGAEYEKLSNEKQEFIEIEDR